MDSDSSMTSTTHSTKSIPDNPLSIGSMAIPEKSFGQTTSILTTTTKPGSQRATPVISTPSRRVSFSDRATTASSKTTKKSATQSQMKKSSSNLSRTRPKIPSPTDGKAEDEICIEETDDADEVTMIIEEPLNDQQNACIAEGLRKPNNCNLAVVPPRATAFQAPCIKLPLDQYGPDGLPLPDQPDGLAFCFYPRGNHATEVSFTVEPRRPPMWQQMMRCGFVPIINCAVPPCSLPEPVKNRGTYYVKTDYYTSSSSDSDSSSSQSSSSDSPSPSDGSSSSDESDESGDSDAPTEVEDIQLPESHIGHMHHDHDKIHDLALSGTGEGSARTYSAETDEEEEEMETEKKKDVKIPVILNPTLKKKNASSSSSASSVSSDY